MSLNTAEKFLLLCLRKDRPGYLVADQSRDTGLTGAILLDLSMEGCIAIPGEGVRIISQKAGLPAAHREILMKISRSKKPKTAKSWISQFVATGGKYRRKVLNDLKNKGIVRLEEKRFLFIPYRRVHLFKKKLREDVVNEIKNVLMKKTPLTEETAVLCGLIAGCRMYRALTGDKQERRKYRSLLKKIPHEQTVSAKVALVIREMQTATALTAITTATLARR